MSIDARTDWENRIGLRSGAWEGDFSGSAPELDPPTGLAAAAGAAQVTLTWDAVPGAIGYQVHVCGSADGIFAPLDHHGRDVTSVPHPPYVDTTGTPGTERWYAVSALSDVHVEGPMSEPVAATPCDGGGRSGDRVGRRGHRPRRAPRPWRPMIGSEHLSHALSTDLTGGRVVGEELTSALVAARDELGVSHVRAHGILCDDLGVYTEVDGDPVHDFSGVDRVYDHLRSARALPRRGALVHAPRPGQRPVGDGLRLRRDRVAAQGLGPLVRPHPRPHGAPGRALRRRGRRALVLRGVERGQPRGVLVRLAG